MKCLHPIWILNPKIKAGKPFNPMVEPKWLQIPCGKCGFCIMKKRSEWSYRMYQEFLASDAVYFFTLTYNDERLVFNERRKPIVYKPHVEQFVKRLNRVLKFKYFISSEYGPTTLRPHYHGLIFLSNKVQDLDDPKSLLKYIGSDPDVFLENVIRPYWTVSDGERHSNGTKIFHPLGVNLQCDWCTSARIHYMSKYLHKSLVPDAPTKCFSMKTPGLGKCFGDDPANVQFLKSGMPLLYNDYKISAPRYLVHKFNPPPKFTVQKQRTIMFQNELHTQELLQQFFSEHPNATYEDYYKDTVLDVEDYFKSVFEQRLMQKSKNNDL